MRFLDYIGEAKRGPNYWTFSLYGKGKKGFQMKTKVIELIKKHGGKVENDFQTGAGRWNIEVEIDKKKVQHGSPLNDALVSMGVSISSGIG